MKTSTKRLIAGAGMSPIVRMTFKQWICTIWMTVAVLMLFGCEEADIETIKMVAFNLGMAVCTTVVAFHGKSV